MTARPAAYAAVGREIAALLESALAPRLVVCVAGESGAGKTTLALAIRDALPRPSCVLHQDDYFRRPPRANARHRRETALASVGPEEIDLARLDDDARAFLGGATSLDVPAADRDADRFREKTLALEGVEVLFVEGTFVCTLEVSAVRVFIDRDYRETRAGRSERARDAVDEHTEQILAIEHALIRPQLEGAHLVVDGALALLRRQWPPKSFAP